MATGLGCRFHSVLSCPGSGVGSWTLGPHGGDKLLEAGIGAHSFHPRGVEPLLFLGDGDHSGVRVGEGDGSQLPEGWDCPHLCTAGCSLGAISSAPELPHTGSARSELDRRLPGQYPRETGRQNEGPSSRTEASAAQPERTHADPRQTAHMVRARADNRH